MVFSGKMENMTAILRYSRVFVGLLFSAIIIAGMVGFPMVADASCACWCKTPDGAEELDAPSADRDACSDACEASGRNNRILGCYDPAVSGGYTPDQNKMCWTKIQCETTGFEGAGLRDGGKVAGNWGGQAGECTKGKGYCYVPPGTNGYAVNLSVPIGDMSTVTDIGRYVERVYVVLLALGALLAVAIFVVAGFLWMTSGGNAGQVARARGMMMNALVGLVLLFGAYTIASFLDPRLAQLALFRVPVAQQVLKVTDDCAKLAEAGYTIGTNGTAFPRQPQVNATYTADNACGVEAEVVAVDKVVREVEGVDVGFACRFTTCEHPAQVCASSGSGYECLRCAEVWGTNKEGFIPSADVCDELVSNYASEYQRLQSAQTAVIRCEFQAEPNGRNACVEVSYTGNEQSSITSGNVYTAPFFTSNGPAKPAQIDCNALRRRQNANCTMYGDVYGIGWGSQDGAGRLPQAYPLSELEDEGGNYPILASVCSDDPCGLAPLNTKCTLLDTRQYAYDCEGIVAVAESVHDSFASFLGNLFSVPAGDTSSPLSVLCSQLIRQDVISCVPQDFADQTDKFLRDTTGNISPPAPIRDMNGVPIP